MTRSMCSRCRRPSAARAPADRRDRRLVDQGEALVDAPHRDERGPLRADREELEIGVTEALADLRRGLGFGQGPFRIPVQRSVERARGREPAVPEVLLDPLEQPRCAVEPRLADREGVPEQVVATELDGGAHRGIEIACPRRSRVGALTGIDRSRQHPQPPGRLREQLQLMRRELTAVVGRGPERRMPGATRAGRARPARSPHAAHRSSLARTLRNCPHCPTRSAWAPRGPYFLACRRAGHQVVRPRPAGSAWRPGTTVG